MSPTTLLTRCKSDIEIGLVAALLLTAVDVPIRALLTVSALLVLLSAAVCGPWTPHTRSWTQSFLNSLILLGAIAFTWVLLVSHASVIARLLILVGAAISIFVVVIGMSRPPRNESETLTIDSNRRRFELLVVAVAALLLSLRGFLPLLPTAIVLLVGSAVFRRMCSNWIRLFVLALIVGSALASRWWFGREPYWFFVSYDQQFRASLATGLTRWGYTDLNSATGTSISYHWLSEAIAGVLSRAGGVDEFIVVTRILPVIGFLGAVASMWRLVRAMGISDGAALIGVLVPALVLLEMDPYSIGTLLGVALTCYCLELALRKSWEVINVLVVAVASTLLLMAQTPFGLTVSLSVFVFLLMSVWRTAQDRAALLLATALLPVTLLVLRLTVLTPGKSQISSGTFGVQNLLQFRGLNVEFGLNPESPAWLTALNSAGYLLEIAVISLPIVLFLRRKNQQLAGMFGMVLTMLVVLLSVSVVVMNTLDLSFAQGKLMSAVLLSFMPASIAAAWSMTRTSSSLLISVIGAVAGVAGARLYFLTRNIARDELAAVLSITFLVSATVILGVVYFRLEKSRTGVVGSTSHIRVVSIVMLVLVLAVSIGRPERIPMVTSRQPIVESQITGSHELRACLGWIRTNTSPSAIIATDMFDPEGLSESGKSHLVSLMTKRRILLDGLYMKFAENELVEQRMLKEGAITETPLPVDYFVVTTELANSERSGDLEVALQNSMCTVLHRQ